MSDITQIQVGSTAYDIRDDTARSAGLPTGGTSGQILKKSSSANYDAEWVNEPSTYPPSSHTHDDRYYTESEVDTALAGKADSSHTHDDRYYTESEVDTKLNAKANSSHTHDDRYYTESEMDTKLDNKVSKSGDTMTGTLIIKKDDRPTIRLIEDDENNSSNCYVYAEDQRFQFNEVPIDSTAYREIYRLPAASTGLSANKWFDILTTKNTITVAQGGTGAKTAADAWNTLEAGVDSGVKYLTNNSVFVGNIYYKKIGQLVIVNADRITPLSDITSTALQLTSIPTGYRSVVIRIYSVGVYRATPVNITIYTGGNLYVTRTGSSDLTSGSASLSFCFAYYTNE